MSAARSGWPCLASGSGSNLQAIIDRLHRRPLGIPTIDPAGLAEAPTIEVALVVSDVPGARALERARNAEHSRGGVSGRQLPHP